MLNNWKSIGASIDPPLRLSRKDYIATKLSTGPPHDEGHAKKTLGGHSFTIFEVVEMGIELNKMAFTAVVKKKVLCRFIFRRRRL